MMVNKMDIFKELETMVSKLKSGGDESVATLSTKLSTYFGKTIEIHITPAKECDAQDDAIGNFTRSISLRGIASPNPYQIPYKINDNICFGFNIRRVVI